MINLDHCLVSCLPEARLALDPFIVYGRVFGSVEDETAQSHLFLLVKKD